MGVVGGAGANKPGTQLEQASCVNGLHQEFQLVPVSGGYKIAIRSSGQALDVRGGTAAVQNGVPIQQYTYYGTSNQIWKVAATADGYYQISAVSSGKSLDVVGVSKADHALIHQWTWWGGENQKWSFVPAD